jgi:hypothetical protein
MQQLHPDNSAKNNATRSSADWFQLYLLYMEQVFGAKLKPLEGVPKAGDGSPITDILCMNRHFLESQISSVFILDNNHKKRPLPAVSDRSTFEALKNHSKGIVAQIDHLEMTYYPPAEDKSEYLEATGMRHNVMSQDSNEAGKALIEKAKSALNLAYAAKAKGWSKVTFGQTSDYMDRKMLILACEYVGIDYSNEKLDLSAHGVQVTSAPSKETPLMQDAMKKTLAAARAEGFTGNPDQQKLYAQALNSIAQVQFNNFVNAFDTDYGRDQPSAVVNADLSHVNPKPARVTKERAAKIAAECNL